MLVATATLLHAARAANAPMMWLTTGMGWVICDAAAALALPCFCKASKQLPTCCICCRSMVSDPFLSDMPEGVQTGGELLLEMRYALLDAFQEVFAVELQVRCKPRWCKRCSCPQLMHKHCVVLMHVALGQGPSLCCPPALFAFAGGGCSSRLARCCRAAAKARHRAKHCAQRSTCLRLLQHRITLHQCLHCLYFECKTNESAK